MNLMVNIKNQIFLVLTVNLDLMLCKLLLFYTIYNFFSLIYIPEQVLIVFSKQCIPVSTHIEKQELMVMLRYLSHTSRFLPQVMV